MPESELRAVQWLAEYGLTLLQSAQIDSLRPLRCRWSESILPWQRIMLEEQLRLAQRAAERFSSAHQWLWTDRSLQQASDEKSAAFKASLIPNELPVIDACCGAGADLVALGKHHDVQGVDGDPLLVELARANLRAHAVQAKVHCGMVPDCLPELKLAELKHLALHIDPDRRPGERRTTSGCAFEPTLDECMLLGQTAAAAIIKLAPATDIAPGAEQLGWRRCWLGSQRECPQQLLLRGSLHGVDWPLDHVAAVLGVSKQPAFFHGDPDVESPVVDQPDDLLYEPHAALYAARLACAWAEPYQLKSIGSPRGYLTGAAIPATGWAQTLRVLDYFAFDDKRVRRWLRAHDAGTLEVKTRLVALDANEYQRRWTQSGQRKLVCLITRVGKSQRVIMAERIAE